MQKLQKVFLIASCCFRLGKNLSDKLRLFILYLKYPLVNRKITNYTNKVLRFNLRLNNRPYTIFLRDNGTDMLIFLSIFLYGEYALPHTFKEKPHVIYDLGANIGLSALWFSSIFPKAQIFGYEPVPDNYHIALKNYENVSGKVFPIAIGNARFKTKMLLTYGNTGAHRLASHLYPGFQIQSEIEVQVESLEDLISKGEVPPPDLLKIDAEGSEVDILEGLGAHLKNVYAVVIEPDAGEHETKCEEILTRNGFQVFRSKSHLIWGIR